MKQRLDSKLEEKFPNLYSTGYRVTSLKDKKYNCIAWAAKQDQEQWWEPLKEPGCYWPSEIKPDYSFQSFVSLFEFLGYTKCSDGVHEAGFEKVAIYCDKDGEFSHVSRQLMEGPWTSKLGPEEDIEHNTPESLVSESYGHPAVFLKRKLLHEGKIN